MTDNCTELGLLVVDRQEAVDSHSSAPSGHTIVLFKHKEEEK